MARRGNPRPYQRTDRIGELVREIVASELERIGAERAAERKRSVEAGS